MNTLIKQTEKLTHQMTEREAGIYAFSLFCQNLADCFDRGDKKPAPLPITLKNRAGAMWYCNRLMSSVERYQILTLQTEREYLLMLTALGVLIGYSPARHESQKAELIALREQSKALPDSHEQADKLAKLEQSLIALDHHKAAIETAPEINFVVDKVKGLEQRLYQCEREFTAFCDGLGLNETIIRAGMNFPKCEFFNDNADETPARAHGDNLLKEILSLPA